ncbi:hypothetical protein Zmor_021339 [Zophobas morio]|uniref:Uncharacterized protein n=1 Tax=Zophobas morio TaxID=2755281 RepID=A0AA38I626_9CUCU|nr:hypothetical protein Zmor_021339 [Zophobas morio]
MNTLEFLQYNNVLNVNHRILDLVISNISCYVSKSDEELVPVDVHHPPLLLMVKSAVKCTNYICGVNTGDNFNFRTADITVLIKGISLIDWSSLNKSTDVNLACEIFYMKLQEVFGSNVPKSIARKHHYPPWFSVDLIKEIKQKSKFWKKYKKYGDKEDYEKFKNLRRVIKVKLAKLYKDYLFKVEGEISNDPNKFWQFVKYKSNGTDIPFNMSLGNVNYSGPKEIVDAFYEMFKSVFTPVTYNLGNYSKESQSLCQYVSLKSISEQDVIEAIYQLKPKYTAEVGEIVHEDSPELEEDMHMVDQVLGLNESDALEQVLETQASHLLEETDISTVLSTIQVDEFSDFFTVNRNGEYEPSREEAEELEKALAAVDNDVKSLEKLSQSQGLLDSLLDEHTLAESLVQIPDVFHNGYTPCGDSMVAQTSSFLLPVEPQSHS